MRPRRSAFLIRVTCPIAAVSFGCGSINLDSTTLGSQEPTADNSSSAVRSSTFYVSGRRLFDPCGQPVVLRGVNEMVTYILPDKNGLPAFTEIEKTNANSVRIYWRTSDSVRDLDQVLSDAESQRLIPIIYVFNAETSHTGVIAPTSVSQAVDYWTSSNVAPVIKLHEHWLIIALREKNDTPTSSKDQWTKDYVAAITRMRNVPINVPLAIDAPSAGSDVDILLASSGQPGRQLIAADPFRNLLLNVNSGVSNDSAETLASQLNDAYAAELPLLIGELSGYSHTANYGCGVVFDYSAVLAAATQTQTGWLAWSWGYAKNVQCSSLDMTSDGTYAGLKDWGLGAAVTDTNSIQNTSQAPRYAPGGSCN